MIYTQPLLLTGFNLIKMLPYGIHAIFDVSNLHIPKLARLQQ